MKKSWCLTFHNIGMYIRGKFRRLWQLRLRLSIKSILYSTFNYIFIFCFSSNEKPVLMKFKFRVLGFLLKRSKKKNRIRHCAYSTGYSIEILVNSYKIFSGEKFAFILSHSRKNVPSGRHRTKPNAYMHKHTYNLRVYYLPFCVTENRLQQLDVNAFRVLRARCVKCR